MRIEKFNFNLQRFADLIHGNSSSEVIQNVSNNTQVYGLAGNDTIASNGSTGFFLIGGSGNDVLQVMGGSGTLNGGSGADSFELTYSKTNTLSAVIEDANPTNDRLTINYSGADGTPTLNYSTIDKDIVITDGNYLNVTLKGYREANDYYDEVGSDNIWEILRLVNNERESEGLTWLTLSQGLTDAAQLRSTEIINSFSHTRPNGTSCFTALEKSYNTTGENIAAGQTSPEDVMNGWMNSSGHRANILNSNFKKLGVGYTYNSDNTYSHYWVQMFGGILDDTETLTNSQLLSTPLTLSVNNSAQSSSTLGNIARLKFTTITGTSGADSITSENPNTAITALAGNDTIDIAGDNVIVEGGNDDDLIINGRWANLYINGVLTGNLPSQYARIDGGDGNDTITSSGSYSTLYGGAGNDLIYNGYYFYEPFGGRGFLTENDSKFTDENQSSYVSITGGAGNDTIYLRGDGHNIINYSNGDGNDIVYGLSSNDTVQINGSYSTVSSGGSVIVSVGDGQITFYGANANSLNITSNSSVIDTYKMVYDYSGGNYVIENYLEGEQINIASDFTGIWLDENNFYVHSSSGTLEIENVRGKAVDYGDAAGNPIARSFMASGGGTVDYRNNSQFQVLIGANNLDNQIYAGSGGSSLWGGIGGNDTLTGGNSYDEFFFTLGCGGDVIRNSGDNDVINLIGVSLDDFTGVDVNESSVSATFIDGSSLRVEGNSGVGYKLGNIIYAVNQSTNEWHTK